MDRREAYERRVWRLAYLLTSGDAAAAAALVRRVVDLQPDLEHLEAARLDRLVVLRARDHARRRPSRRKPPATGLPSAPPLPDAPRRALEIARSLGTQAMEAWVLARIDGLDLLQVSRAMDCSKTAAERHLEKADDALRMSLGVNLENSITQLRHAADALDPGPILRTYRLALRKNRRIRVVTWALALVLAGLLCIWLAIGR